MAFLTQKERIFDFVLTDKGRELLSKNQLNFVYFAFSDEGIDYSGSLSASAVISSSFDDYVHRDFSFEADQRTNEKKLLQNNDLKSFLYTIPSSNAVLPEMVTSKNNTSSVVLNRQYVIDRLDLSTRKRTLLTQPLATIMRATVPRNTISSRVSNYVYQQKENVVKSMFSSSQNVVGLSIGNRYIVLSGDRVLDKITGTVFLASDFLQEQINQENSIDLSSFKKEVEHVVGVDAVKIDLLLKTSNGAFPIKDGFLIEVYDSGSDGKLTRLIRESVEDAANDETVQEGFESFLQLEVDKE